MIPPRGRCRATGVDLAAERYLDTLLALDPIAATVLGLPGGTGLTDFSPAGHEARAAHARRTLAELEGLEPTDPVDEVTVAALDERLRTDLDLHAAGIDLASLNNIASPVQLVREVFDVAPATTVQDWEANLLRLGDVPAALAGVRESLRHAVAHGGHLSRRQVATAAAQAQEFGDRDGFFPTLVARASSPRDTQGPDGPLQRQLRVAARGAADAYTSLATWLREELLPVAAVDSACGRDLYPLVSRSFLGTTVDLDETYEWGLAQVAEIEESMALTAARIVPGVSGRGAIDAAIEALDADPARQIEGAEDFRHWMQEVADRAVESLADTHFLIPPALRTLTCRIAPSTSGAIYYTSPTDDMSRPGQMWWAVPQDITGFSTWREISTIYHEGVPGHHLQIAGTIHRREQLNRWRRLGCWVSGHGEGWALYAERLMAELGFLDDPGDLMGQLDSQALRAARVVVDIGVHCRLRAPEEVGAGVWDDEKAWRYLRAHTRLHDSVLRFELDRYLGWPGQAPSYKIGERVWLELREAVRARQGASFDLRAFHTEALAVGSVGLDVLRRTLLERGPAPGPSKER